MEIKFTKGNDRDYIEARRPDGTIAKATFPKKGWFPHDAVHLVVEKALGYETAFWGRVFSGAEPSEIAAIAKAGGHASSSRAHLPQEQIVELIQAERIVECFEVEMWGQPSDCETFRSVLEAACAHSKVPNPNLSEQAIHAIRSELQVLSARWQKLTSGEEMVLRWS
jgi:hypothetical protein